MNFKSSLVLLVLSLSFFLPNSVFSEDSFYIAKISFDGKISISEARLLKDGKIEQINITKDFNTKHKTLLRLNWHRLNYNPDRYLIQLLENARPLRSFSDIQSEKRQIKRQIEHSHSQAEINDLLEYLKELDKEAYIKESSIAFNEIYWDEILEIWVIELRPVPEIKP